MSRLPDGFVENMIELLGVAEAESLFASFRSPRTHGLRINPLKICMNAKDDSCLRALDRMFGLQPVPWCPSGYYYDERTAPGKHPYHQAGLYYIQEPSAMLAAELLDPRPGDLVLDLAAAPGGKSTHIAGKLRGEGLLVANDVHPERAKALSENIERFGVANAVVTNADPWVLAERFPAFFDKLMLDAPCSGEGMFRKDPEAAALWSAEKVRQCSALQADMLDAAAIMLKPGGTLAYSTCTFNREENERTVESFVARHPEFAVVRTERIWPHRQRGEGHFVALLRKREESAPAANGSGGKRRRTGTGKSGAPEKRAREAERIANDFVERMFPGYSPGPGSPLLFGEQLYRLPAPAVKPFRDGALDGVRLLRPGLHIGVVKNGRFEPAHALALAAPAGGTAENEVSFPADSPEIAAYLRGETIGHSAARGWCRIAVDGFPLGWGKADGHLIKNRYPRGLRRRV